MSLENHLCACAVERHKQIVSHNLYTLSNLQVISVWQYLAADQVKLDLH